MSFVKFEHVKKIYHMGEVTIEALSDADFEIEKGEICVIVGPSGAGKTTLLNILGGMDSLTSGRVILDGVEISNYKEKELTSYRRHEIGFVFQFYNLVQNLTALENVSLATQICDNPMDPATALKHVGLEDRMNNFPAQLSGGEQQRVCIARAIVNEPKLLVCDEPTGNLDPDHAMEIMDVISKINTELKTTVVMATHDKSIVNKMKKRVLVIKNGMLVGDYAKGSYKVNEKD